MVDLDSTKEKRKRPDLWSYLIVGLVGAVIGGFLVVGIAPQVLIHRMGLTYTSANPPTITESGTSPVTTPTASPDSPDPWERVIYASEKVSPAVVGIVNRTYVVDFLGRRFGTDSSGSGLIVTQDGYIVTNNHVVEYSSGLTVFLADGRSFPATVVGTDPATDLAVIKIDAEGLPIGVFGDSDKLRPGQLAVAIGNPLGLDFKFTVTQGVISGLDRVLTVGDFSMRLIQTDAVINPGNSGGPLVNADGEVIGLNVVKINAESVEGMNFAIPSNQVKRIANQIIATGKVKRAMVGVRLVDKQAATTYALGINIEKGVYVYEVIQGGPAAKAGLKQGDIILSLNGKETDKVATFQALLAEMSPGETVELKVRRNRQDLTISVVLGEATAQ